MTPRILLLALLPLAACSAPQIEATPEVGFTKLKGDFAAATGSIGASTSMKDLGLDGRETQPGARVDLKWGSPHLSIAYHQTDTEGSGTTTANLTHDGTTITAGTATDSELDIEYLTGIVTFDFAPTDFLELGLGLGVQAAHVQTKITETGTANTIETDETVPVPVLAARVGVDVGPLDFDALLNGIDVDYGGDNLRFYELDLRARWEFASHFHALVGWHRWNVDLEYDDGADAVAVDVTAEGPYFGLGVSF